MTAPEVNKGLDSLPADQVKRSVTIGKFDGVHRGHRRVIDQLIEASQGLEPTVITFDRHPHTLIRPHEAPLPLVSERQKVELLGGAGVQRVVILPFNEELSRLSHHDFSRIVLATGLSATKVLVGGDFRYGHGGMGNISTLQDEGAEFGFSVDVVGDVCEAEGQRVSSTMIRELLDQGRVGEVSELLNREHRVRGVVGAGFQRGRVLGYPTANLSGDVEGYLPADGVYATRVTFNGQIYGAATSIGVNPTFGDLSERTIESHLLDANLDLYDQNITVEFVEFIRGMRKFPDADALATQMGVDEQEIRRILNTEVAP
jgi:riboflavin kinase / FMN adenylyltransferase